MDEQAKSDLCVRLGDENLYVEVDCVPGGEETEVLLKRLQGNLATLGLKDAIADADLAQWFSAHLSAGGELKGAVLLRGTPAVPPVDGRIEWAGSFFDTGFVVDPASGVIDYRQHAAQRTVTEGQCLARVTPPVEGVDGRDVFGHVVRAGKARAAKIRAGQNVCLDEGEGTFRATKDGRIRWDSEVLSVDEVFCIEGSVGLKTGNVEHLGAVEIRGDVEAGTRVSASGDIVVHQVVEAADVACGGSLSVQGGITGSEGTEIRVAGSLHARFIQEARIEAGDDIVAEREIVRSSLKTRGAVVMPGGRVIGGEVTALGGIQVAHAGSVASVPTLLVAGEDFRLGGELRDLEAQVVALEEQASKIRPVLESALPRLKSLPVSKQETVRVLEHQVAEIAGEVLRIREEMEDRRSRSEERAKYTIEVREMIYPETMFVIRGERLHVRQEVAGPVRAVYYKGRVELRAVT